MESCVIRGSYEVLGADFGALDKESSALGEDARPLGKAFGYLGCAFGAALERARSPSPKPTLQLRSEAVTAAKERPRGFPPSAFHPDGSARTREAIQNDGVTCVRISKAFLRDGVTPRYKMVDGKRICHRCYHTERRVVAKCKSLVP